MAPPMGLSCTICYHFGAVIIFFIASVPFFNNAQFAPPMANLSTIWINKPAIDNSFNVFSPSILNPVLETSSSNGSQMICGFYCPSTQQTQPSSCLFGVVILRGKRAYKWNLILHDSDGTFVWSTNTSGKFVFGLNFTELGNLVFFGRNNATVWQSFDHPTDSLLVGQTFFPGKKLTSSTSASNWTTGLFSLKFHEDNSLVAYVESNPPLPYFESHSNVKYVKFENENFNGQLILAASSSSPQFIRLDPDGHLKAYEWTGWNWNAVADLLTLSMGECGYPMARGNYGICSPNGGQCGCFEEAAGNSTFRQINYKQPSLGCFLVTPISCNNSLSHTLLELNNTSYFYFNFLHTYASKIFYLDEKMALVLGIVGTLGNTNKQ
ncbi:hypothetical protein CsSME_00027594 [Camellia sinensis var. sinensis]